MKITTRDGEVNDRRKNKDKLGAGLFTKPIVLTRDIYRRGIVAAFETWYPKENECHPQEL